MAAATNRFELIQIVRKEIAPPSDDDDGKDRPSIDDDGDDD
eukprot:CAMPEP_0172542152 /NCGR_PEP_ID=MMETSP1067-20121228/12823_1 /TAXON_ID=265564 ORGANISM="Thalassiosira punctigera, Strain Tpunct2005C2" /NCGR_SAMPLE_ID=MMETSP1067 /ASSEMBLY_ACC=CAM_ASM_000444 /LENGTH=40 /DNA_ID= /DNA_START= /DNA_END= /DNA_ORIENTATION=